MAILIFGAQEGELFGMLALYAKLGDPFDIGPGAKGRRAGAAHNDAADGLVLRESVERARHSGNHGGAQGIEHARTIERDDAAMSDFFAADFSFAHRIWITRVEVKPSILGPARKISTTCNLPPAAC